MRSYYTCALHCLLIISLLAARPGGSCSRMPNSLESSCFRLCLDFFPWLSEVRGKVDIWFSSVLCKPVWGVRASPSYPKMEPRHKWSSAITRALQHQHLFSEVPHPILYIILSVQSVKSKARRVSVSSSYINLSPPTLLFSCTTSAINQRIQPKNFSMINFCFLS